IVIQEGKLIGERTIKNENNSLEEKLDVEIEVDNIDLAKKLINSVGVIKVEENRIVINLRRDEIPLIINRLIDGGLKIYEVKQITQSLEEVFLSMTKEGK
ncbi:MAG TPA: ABC transporter ATP-binding protein, partial [Clostridium sp.]|nr:ABC transporter ATP-binding protein [Clostridium sp.]